MEIDHPFPFYSLKTNNSFVHLSHPFGLIQPDRLRDLPSFRPDLIRPYGSTLGVSGIHCVIPRTHSSRVIQTPTLGPRLEPVFEEPAIRRFSIHSVWITRWGTAFTTNLRPPGGLRQRFSRTRRQDGPFFNVVPRGDYDTGHARSTEAVNQPCDKFLGTRLSSPVLFGK